MNVALTLPVASASPLCRLDPRWKLAGIVLLIVAVAFLQTLASATVALVAALLLLAAARLPARWVLTRVTAVALFLLMLAVWLPFTVRGSGPVWQLGPLRISEDGLRMAGLLCAKALSIVLLVLVLLTTAPLDATLKAAHALRAPSLLVQLVALTYRYLFVLTGELARVRVALRVRGYRNRANRHSYRIVGHIAGNLLVRSYERAERVAQAMRCRAFDGRFRTLTEFHTRLWDPVVFASFLTFAVGLALGDWFLR